MGAWQHAVVCATKYAIHFGTWLALCLNFFESRASPQFGVRSLQHALFPCCLSFRCVLPSICCNIFPSLKCSSRFPFLVLIFLLYFWVFLITLRFDVAFFFYSCSAEICCFDFNAMFTLILLIESTGLLFFLKFPFAFWVLQVRLFGNFDC